VCLTACLIAADSPVILQSIECCKALAGTLTKWKVSGPSTDGQSVQNLSVLTSLTWLSLSNYAAMGSLLGLKQLPALHTLTLLGCLEIASRASNLASLCKGCPCKQKLLQALISAAVGSLLG